MTEKILMCRPDYYGIKYEINPWMNVNIQADNNKAKIQWENLYSTLKDDLKVDVKMFPIWYLLQMPPLCTAIRQL